MSAASLLNGWADRPWKERAQSTCLLPSSRTIGSSARPLEVMSLMEDCESMAGAFGVEDEEAGLGVYFGVDEAALGVDAATAALRRFEENCRELHLVVILDAQKPGFEAMVNDEEFRTQRATLGIVVDISKLVKY